MSGLSINAAGAASVSKDTTAASAGGRSGDKPASGFDALLTASPAPTSSDKPPVAADVAGKRQDSVADTEERQTTTPEGESINGGVEKPAREPVDEGTDAQWPPFGLAGLIPVPLEPAPMPTAPLPQAPAAAGNALPAPMAGALALPGQEPLATGSASAVPAVAEAMTEAATEQLVLPRVTETLQLDDSVETPAPLAFQQLLQGMTTPEVRTSAATSAVPPGATPDVNSPDFDEAFGARIGWLADQKIGHAHIRVTPHDMGQIDVKLQLDGDRLHATFTSANAEVRQALESSLPRLREMLGEQGLQLAQADVGQQQNSPERDEPGVRNGIADNGQADASDVPASAMSSHSLRLRGLLDAYA